MRISKNNTVNDFLTQLKHTHPEKFPLVVGLREIVFEVYPDTKERIMYGGIMFSADHDFGGIYVYTHHVSFEFSKGATFDDPHKFLEGKGKHRRHIKFRTGEEIQTVPLTSFITQAL